MSHPFLHAWDPGRYTLPYLRSGIPEESVQIQVIGVLRAMGVTCWAVDAGAKNLRGRAFGALVAAGRRDLLGRLKGTTGAGMSGLSDVIGVAKGGRAVFVEVKAPAKYVASASDPDRLVIDRAAGQPTREQLEFLAAVHKRGAVAGVAWAAQDAVSIYEQGTRAAA